MYIEWHILTHTLKQYIKQQCLSVCCHLSGYQKYENCLIWWININTILLQFLFERYVLGIRLSKVFINGCTNIKIKLYNKKLIYRFNKLFLQYLSWTVKCVKEEYLNLYNVQQQTLIYQKPLTNIKINVI